MMTPTEHGNNSFPDRPWTIHEVARYLSVTTRTIHAWKKDRGLPHRYAGRDLRFIREEVDEWLDNQPGMAA